MAGVRRIFNELIGDDESESQDDTLSEHWRELWQDALQEDDTTPVLAHLSDDDRHRVVALIADFRLELNKRAIGPRGRSAGSPDAAPAERCLFPCRRPGAAFPHDAAAERHHYAYHLS